MEVLISWIVRVALTLLIVTCAMRLVKGWTWREFTLHCQLEWRLTSSIDKYTSIQAINTRLYLKIMVLHSVTSKIARFTKLILMSLIGKGHDFGGLKL